MWELLKLIPSALGLAKDGVAAWSAHDQKKQDVSLEKYKVDGKVDEVALQTELSRLSLVASNSIKQDNYLGGRMMRYVFVYPLGFWWTMCIVDSVFHQMIGWTWRVGTFPILETWGGWMVAYLFLHSTLIARK